MEKMNVIWKPVIYFNAKGVKTDFTKEYLVNQFGEVKGIKRGNILKPIERNKGRKRWCVNLCKNGKFKQYFIHRIVLSSFVPESSTYEEVNHKDENPSNNNLDNLEWCSHAYNTNYGTRNKRIQKANSKTIQQIDSNGNVINEYSSALQAQRNSKHYFRQSDISACCRGERLTHKGFKWQYK